MNRYGFIATTVDPIHHIRPLCVWIPLMMILKVLYLFLAPTVLLSVLDAIAYVLLNNLSVQKMMNIGLVRKQQISLVAFIPFRKKEP